MTSEKRGKAVQGGLVPRLRFPEFAGASAWRQRALGALAVRQTEKNLDGACQRVLTNSAEFGVVDQRDYFDKDIATPDSLTNYWIVRRGDYVYNPRTSALAPVGPISKSNIDIGAMSPLYTVFRFQEEQNEFYKHYFRSSHWYTQVRRASNTGARNDRMSMANSEFFAIPMPVPGAIEQKKIADCLSSLDERIAAETRQLDALKTHKQGLLRQFFPREAEAAPRTHVGQTPTRWHVERLGDVATVVRGGSPRPIDEYLTSAGNGYRWLKIGDLDKDAKYVDYTNEWIRPAGLPKTREIHSGDLILSNSMSFGRPYVSRIDACIHDGWLAITNIAPAVTSEFLYYLLGGLACQTYFRDSAAGSGVRNLNVDLLDAMPISYPALDAQQQIVATLSSIDDLIAAQARKIDLLKQHKRGLMQQLFPVLE